MLEFCGQEKCTLDANGRIKLNNNLIRSFRRYSEEEIILHCLPEGAIAAYITVEADENANNNEVVIRVKDNGSDPTNILGLGVGNYDDIEIKGRNSLENFKAIGIEIGKSHTLRVQYYKTNQEV